ncbi:MAG: nitrile hydratase subunit beta [Mycobacterium sp.]|nr:nitrile hydratase subunit beta [Mycobacterium sp.]
MHDLGGLDGFGPVEHTDAEPLFEQEWQRRAFGLMIGWLDAQSVPGGRFRHSIERMAPEHYLSAPYYERWLTGLTTMVVESGFTTPDELERRAEGRFPLSRPDRGVLPEDLSPHSEPRYAVGDEVRVRAWHPPGHTRAPRYAQGKRGTIARFDGAHAIDDIAAHGGGSVADPQYSVRFTSRELWGEAGTDDDVIHIDLFERYLEDLQ